MPNWVDCELNISGDKKRLQEFRDFANSERKVLDEEKFIPYPERFREMDREAKEAKRNKDGFNSGGYEWCIKNWGTKWGICNPVLQSVMGERDLIYDFESAWSPPCPVILEMSKKFPELEFQLRYFEGGSGFNGLYECIAGKTVTDEEGKYFGHRGG